MEAPDPEQTKEAPTVEQTKEAPTKEAPTKEAPTKEAPAISAAQRVMPEIKMKDGMPCYVTTIFGYVLADASADGLAQAKFPGMSEAVEIPGMMFERPVKRRPAGAMMKRPAAKRPAKAGTTNRARLEDEQAEEKAERRL